MDHEMDENDTKEYKYSLFLKLFMGHQSRLLGFILKLMPNYSVAEDILQDTTVTLWEKFSSFEEGTDFMAWAKQVARYKVMNFIKKNKNRSIVQFSNHVLEELSKDEPPLNSQNRYHDALENCVGKLEGNSRKVIRLRYMNKMKVQDIALQFDVNSNTLSKHISRIHYHLKRCIEQTLSAWNLTNG